jgi:hypothetical protein
LIGGLLRREISNIGKVDVLGRGDAIHGHIFTRCREAELDTRRVTLYNLIVEGGAEVRIPWSKEVAEYTQSLVFANTLVLDDEELADNSLIAAPDHTERQVRYRQINEVGIGLVEVSGDYLSDKESVFGDLG